MTERAPRIRVQRRPVHGVLLLDKPLGLSSSDALQKAKWLLRAEKAGHTGTLDPLATGVLPLCFGAATKFSQLQLEARKTYEAVALLGTVTMMAKSSRSEMDSYQRVQALTLVQDMVSRINANRQVADCYSNGTTGLVAGNVSAALPTCASGTALQSATANSDLAAWQNSLLGAAETSGGSKVGAMIGGAIVAYIPLRFTAIADYKYLIFGVALVIIMIFRSQGLFPARQKLLAYGRHAYQRLAGATKGGAR